MRTLIFGDTHGCIEELQELLDKFDKGPQDRIVSVGDLVDKGPDSPGCVKLCRLAGVELVMGNHEEKLVRLARHLYLGNQDRAKSLRNYDELMATYSRLDRDDLRYLRHSLPYLRDPSGFTVVHGGIEPRVMSIPTDHTEFYALSGKERGGIWSTKWVRYVAPNGKMVQLGSERPEHVYWANVYDGRFGHVFFGHQPFWSKASRKFLHATALDTGCVYGGELTGVILEHESGSYQISNEITVTAKATYFEDVVWGKNV